MVQQFASRTGREIDGRGLDDFVAIVLEACESSDDHFEIADGVLDALRHRAPAERR